MQKWKRCLPTAAKGKLDNSEKSSFIQPNPEREMKETAEDQKRANCRVCTQNGSTNDNIGYLKGQENPDIHLLIFHTV